MEQNENSSFRAFQNSEQHDRSAGREVVFVLRVRAGKAGWWGQVHRLDSGSLRYVANHSDLFAMLAGDWDLDYNAHASYRHLPQE